MPIALEWHSKSQGIAQQSEPIQAVLCLESLVYAQGSGYLDARGSTSPPGWDGQNQIIYGDNFAAMSALLPEWENRIDLIYADPPFFTNRKYPARIGRGEDSRQPQDWKLAEGYSDHWKSMEEYLDMLYPRLVMMHRLLSPTGTLYLHLDWHADAYARLLLDEIFGPERLLNEIVWVYHGPSPIRSAFNRKHDILLVYTKTKEYTFNADDVRLPYDPTTIKTFESSPKAGFGKVPDLERGKVPEDWWYFPVVARLHSERTGYPTQKPEGLLERIILASSKPGDVVADFFCGSGTTAVVASRLGRRFIASDAAWRAVHTTRTRLVNPSRGQPEGVTFAMQYLYGKGFPPNLLAEIQFARLEGARVCIDTPREGTSCNGIILDEIDFWEVDPEWDGQVFRSAAQAVRTGKKKTIPLELDLPLIPCGNPVCIRMVDVHGNRREQIA